MEFSVVLTNTMYIDKVLWRLWLLGLSMEQCFIILKDKRDKPFILTQFRNFELLEPWLHRPKSLYTQMLLWLPPVVKAYLIQTYYSFDERVVREILGRKLNSRARKELEEIVSKTKVPLIGCRRIFDNLKRVSKRLEDTTGLMIDTIQHDFLLSKELANQYANIVFLNYYRIDTFKKKLSYLRFSDFEHIGSALMQYYTYRNGTCLDELDSGLCQDSRDLKFVLFNSKETLDELKILVSSNVDNFIDKMSSSAFKTMIRSILVIGAGLVHAKELKDIILNIQGTYFFNKKRKL